MQAGHWYNKILQASDKLYPKYGYVDIEFRANDGDVDVVAVIRDEKKINPWEPAPKKSLLWSDSDWSDPGD